MTKRTLTPQEYEKVAKYLAKQVKDYPNKAKEATAEYIKKLAQQVSEFHEESTK